ncbi:MAG: hypothetical protein H6Q90_6784 [Deltaproteobacteria bacterium]|nr:hypothetical protein [Deltaproteobacteria bacterium]
MAGPASPTDAVNPQPAQSSIASTRIQVTVSGEPGQVTVGAHADRRASPYIKPLTPCPSFSYRWIFDLLGRERALFLGRGITPGVVGSTDGAQRPVAVSPTTLAPDPNGVRITPAHLHQALRKLAGIDGSADAAAFPLAGGEMPILG